MATAPLFVSTIDALKDSIRLGGAVSKEAEALIQGAVQKVRLSLFDRLGADRVTELQGYPFEENPTTSTGLLRLRACLTESSWVKLHLMRAMPILFRDAAAAAGETWNQDALGRQIDSAWLKQEMQSLEAEINDSLVILEGEQDSEGPSVRASTIGTDTNTSPGSRYFTEI